MIRTCLLVLALGAGCRTQHLGADTGVAYRGAFSAQRESDPEKTPTFTADDAKAARARQRAGGKDAVAAVPASASILMPAPLSSSSSGSWQGAKGNMSLEAK